MSTAWLKMFQRAQGSARPRLAIGATGRVAAIRPSRRAGADGGMSMYIASPRPRPPPLALDANRVKQNRVRIRSISSSSDCGASRVRTGRAGMQQAASAWLFDIIGTLVDRTILDYRWIAIGMFIRCRDRLSLGMWADDGDGPAYRRWRCRSARWRRTLGGIGSVLQGVRQLRRRGNSGCRAWTRGAARALTSRARSSRRPSCQEICRPRPPQTDGYRGQNLANGALFAFTLGLMVFVVLTTGDEMVFTS